jgi:hypothetical protein
VTQGWKDMVWMGSPLGLRRAGHYRRWEPALAHRRVSASANRDDSAKLSFASSELFLCYGSQWLPDGRASEVLCHARKRVHGTEMLRSFDVVPSSHVDAAMMLPVRLSR